jgi:hypothetical protein
VGPEHLRGGFGDAVGQSVFNPVVLIVVLIVGLLIGFGSRNRAIAAFLAGAVLIPLDQILVIGGMHFPMLRVLLLFGMVRMVRAKASATSTILSGGWNKIDLAMVVLTVITAVNGILLYRDSATVVFELGGLYTAFGCYFLLRFLIRDERDLVLALRTFAWVAAVVAGVMLYEQATGRNPIYGLLGGAHASMFGSVLEREGRRATGPFGHPILAGTFGAITLPLFVGLWRKDKKYRKTALAGIGAAAVIPFAANSSTALLGFIGGVVALCFWPLRKQMRLVRWSIALTLIVLHLVMKAPVWHLISRIDLSGGSSSYHRFQLLNQCILHFSDWWLIGTKYYGDWGWDMWDLSNQYVGIADTSGLIALVCFIAMIVFGFKYLGRARKIFRQDGSQELFIWAMGSSLFANVVAFFGIGYFDQTIVVWYALMAMICAVVLAAKQVQRKPDAGLSVGFGTDLEPEVKVVHSGPDGSASLDRQSGVTRFLVGNIS